MEFDPPPPPFEGSGMGARRIFGRVLGFGGTRVMFTGDGDNRITSMITAMCSRNEANMSPARQSGYHGATLVLSAGECDADVVSRHRCEGRTQIYQSVRPLRLAAYSSAAAGTWNVVIPLLPIYPTSFTPIGLV